MVTHQNMTFTAGSLVEYLRLGTDDRILNVLPLAFDYGLYQLLMSVWLGATLVLEKTFAFPARMLERIEQEHVTVFPGVPTVYATLLGMRATGVYPSVRRLTNTAAALPPAYHDRLRELFPNALIYRMYGLTECKRVSYLEPELVEAKPDSVGKAIPGTEALVLDHEGRPVRPGETGILHVRGPHVMAGYWNAPEQTAHMLREGRYPGDRMLCTHDRFTVDEEGFLYFVGRSDEIIKTRGEKVSPVEVENALHAIEGVRGAAVVGVPDETLGEAVRAYVALEPWAELTERDIRREAAARLEPFMVPRDVVLVEELPRTDSGKIRKRELLEEVT
jgi:acyl-CoA synthetase (AMP-forming)/AMP-acid ligase II